MSKYRLHEIECALELYSSDPHVFRPAELYQIPVPLRKELQRFNLYVVARRPRLSLVPSSLVLSRKGSSVSGVVEAQLGPEKKQFRFECGLPPQLAAARVGQHDYPFDYLSLWTLADEPIRIRVHDVLRFSNLPHSPLTDMHVEYIGKAFGETGERDVVDRLIGNTGKVGHGSLQKILAEVNASHPDQEVHLLLYSFEFHKRLMVGGGFAGTPQPHQDLDAAPERFDAFFESEVARGTRIELAEAALIRHFAPPYNEIYKTSFPSHTHKILDRLHDLDITGLAVSLSTLEHRVRLRSTRVAPSDAHCITYPIVTDTDRQSFFDIAAP